MTVAGGGHSGSVVTGGAQAPGLWSIGVVVHGKAVTEVGMFTTLGMAALLSLLAGFFSL